MTGPLGALERSLRDGPPDESGYRAQPLDLPKVVEDHVSRMEPLEPAVLAPASRRPRATASWQYLAAAVLVAVAIAAVGIVGASRETVVNQPSAPTMTVPPLTRTFVSPRNGYSIRYPASWTVAPATASWPPDIFLPGGHPANDQFDGAGTVRLRVASQPLGAGQTEEEWIAGYFHPYQGANPCSNNDHTTWPRLLIGGQSGYLDVAGCAISPDARISERDVSFDAIVFSGGRVYQFNIDGDVDLAYFRALLATVQLDPEHAVDDADPS